MHDYLDQGGDTEPTTADLDPMHTLVRPNTPVAAHFDPSTPIPASRSSSPAPRPSSPPSPVGIGARLPKRTRRKPREWWKPLTAELDPEDEDNDEQSDLAYEIAFSSSFPDEPLTYAEAMCRPDADSWRQAALEELGAHESNGTWKLVDKPPGAKVIGSVRTLIWLSATQAQKPMFVYELYPWELTSCFL